MATNDKTGPADEAVEGSWSPRRAPSAKAAPGRPKQATPDPEALTQDIDKTREELAETLDAIADRVSPKRVATRTTKAAQDGASQAVENVKETAAETAAAVKGGVAKAREKVSGEPVEVASTPGALADTAVTPIVPPGAEAPVHTSTPPAAPSRMPLYAGALAALVALLLLRRRHRR